MDFSGCVNDDVMEPAVVGCRGDFDFTIKFEKIVFSLLPAAIFIAACAPRIASLWHCRVLVRGTVLRLAKLVSGPSHVCGVPASGGG